MTTAAAEFIKSFDALAPDVQREVLDQLLRLVPAEYGPLSDAELTALAGQLFQMYDAEEEASAAEN